MPLHRFNDPSYYLGVGASFPGTIFGASYDRVNVVSGGTGASGSANVDGPKTSGPNVGTLFVAFGEDATSAHFNRGFKALAENTDLLDDLVHRDLVQIDSSSFTSSGDASKDLSGALDPIYVGSGENVDEIFVVVDTATNGLLFDKTTGAIITVASITGATLGSGFTTANPLTVTFSATIPAAQNYTIYFGRRRSAATMAQNIVTLAGLPSMHMLADLVRDILRGGLDARYRNALTPAAAKLDSAGAGSSILRDGAAPRTVLSSNPQPFEDKIEAQWVAQGGGVRGSAAVPNGKTSAPSGFVSYAARRSMKGATSHDDGGFMNASSYLTLWPHDFSGAISGARTQITPSLSATLKSGASLGQLLLNASDFFHDGTNTSVAVGYDVLEVTRASGAVESYVICGLDAVNPQLGHIRTTGDGFPTVASDETVTVRWLSTMFAQGGGAQTFFSGVAPTGYDPKWSDSLFVAVPQLLSSSSINEVLPRAPEIYAQSINGDPYGGGAAPSALNWGGFDQRVGQGYQTKGALKGDGSIETTHVKLGIYTQSGSGLGISWNPKEQGASLEVTNTGTGAAAVTLALDADYAPAGGEEIAIAFRQNAAGVTTMTATWPASFKFSGLDASLPTTNGAVVLYRGIYNTQLSKFLMTRTDY